MINYLCLRVSRWNNECGHCFRRWIPAVWECSLKTFLGGNYTEILWWQTLLRHLRITITFQMLWNEIVCWLVRFCRPIAQSHITFLKRLEEFIRKMHFHLPLFTLTLFRTSQKPPHASIIFFWQIKGFLFEIWCFQHSFLMRYFKLCIKIGWWKHSYWRLE